MSPAVDEVYLAASLDDVWRTPLAIKRKFKILGETQSVAAVLGRLAKTGRIEQRLQVTGAVRRGVRQDHKAISIEFFRRRQ